MKLIGNAIVFGLGAATGVGAVMGIEALNKNKYIVKKTINDVIDNVSKTVN